MECFEKKDNDLKPLAIIIKRSILDVLQGSENVSGKIAVFYA